MVHYSHFTKQHRVEDAVLMFQTREASKIFLIILADFLSLPRDGTFGLSRPGAEGSLGRTYLGHILNVASAPNFKGDVTLLTSSVRLFASGWMALPMSQMSGCLRSSATDHLHVYVGWIISRFVEQFRSTGSRVSVMLLRNCAKSSPKMVRKSMKGRATFVIPEFQEWFQDNIFIASSTRVAWHLNEIRWGIYHYLVSEFRRAYIPTEVVTGAQMYRFDIPHEITEPLVRSMVLGSDEQHTHAAILRTLHRRSLHARSLLDARSASPRKRPDRCVAAIGWEGRETDHHPLKLVRHGGSAQTRA